MDGDVEVFHIDSIHREDCGWYWYGPAGDPQGPYETEDEAWGAIGNSEA